MSPRGSNQGGNVLEVRALLLGRVSYGEADLIVHLFTDTLGKISALARGARKSHKRFGGALEPVHTIKLEVTEKPRGDLHTLKGASLDRPRLRLLDKLDALTTAGKGLGWIRKAAPPHTPEPLLWRTANGFLDRLSSEEEERAPERLLAGFGIRLLEVLGWGLNLVACVSCGKPCPPERPAWVSPERGGLICRSCGGGPIIISAEAREELNSASQDDGFLVSIATAPDALKIVERALGAHMGLEQGGSSRSGKLGSRYT